MNDFQFFNCHHCYTWKFNFISFLNRFEIEKKLRMAKKQEMKKKHGKEKKYTSTLKMDPKERSKERKKTVEENRGKVDKKAQAMNLLKARREEKKERGS